MLDELTSDILTPSRLVLARKRLRMTLTDLEKASGISRRSITAYENGHTPPTPATISLLARASACRRALPHWSRGPRGSARDISASRAMSKTPAVERDAAAAASRVAMLINQYLTERYRLPDPDLPTLPHLTPEDAADRVRADWRLGDGPIPNVVHLLESKGVRVFSLAADCRAIDAFCTTQEKSGTPFIFLNTAKSGERSRFDGAHELGHLVIHTAHRVPHGPEAEKEAQAFASAFLMPRRSLMQLYPFNPSLHGVLALKRQSRVSAVAMTYRLHEVGLLNDWQYRTIIRSLSQMGYRSGEPDGIARETSQLLSKVLKLQMSKGKSMRTFAADIGISVDELNLHLFSLVPVIVDGEGQRPADASKQPKLELVGSAHRRARR